MKRRESVPSPAPKNISPKEPADDPLASLKLPADPPKPRPMWFAVAAILWLAWLAFLIAMALGW